ncbi:MAG: STAS domain-containing protein [Planctomycetes bacterium]|nr:STAS domain-containing protein [Planctomycetota bacterium]
MPELTIDIQNLPDEKTMIKLRGFLDAHTFEQLDSAIQELFSQGKYRLVVDLKDVEYISSAGAGVFIGSLAIAQENGGNIIITQPTPNVQEVFDLLGLSQIFTIFETSEEGLAQLA